MQQGALHSPDAEECHWQGTQGQQVVQSGAKPVQSLLYGQGGGNPENAHATGANISGMR